MLFGKDGFLKKNHGKLLLGYELSRTYVQISYIKVGDSEPETLSMTAGTEDYNIPFMLFWAAETGVWYFGKEALERSKSSRGETVEELFTLACTRKKIPVGNENYETAALLALFIKRSLCHLTLGGALEQIAACTFILESPEEEKIKVLRRVIEYLQLPGVDFHFMGKKEGFFHYILNQEKELWKNQVFLYEMQKDCLTGYRLKQNHNTSPVVTLIDKKSYPSMSVKIPVTKQQKEERDREFLNHLKQDLEGEIVSTVYLIGDGFWGEWYKMSVTYLCAKRRVFLGNNLFTKGACYGLRDQLMSKEESPGYVYLGEDKLMANVGLLALKKGEEVYLPVLDGGSSWYESHKEWDFIIEKENSLQFRITPLDGKNVMYAEIILHGLELKQQKYSRIHVEVSMETREKMVVKIWEKGFGDFFSSMDQYWEEVILL